MNLSIFTEVKVQISARKAAEFYGLRVGRNGLACCPFHDDKHPSMKIDQYYYCFGCGAKGDAINYVSTMYGLPPYEAARKIVDDFQLIVEVDTVHNKAEKMKIVEKARAIENEKKQIVRIQNQFQSWCNEKIAVLKDCVQTIESAKKYLINKPLVLILESDEFAELLHAEPVINY